MKVTRVISFVILFSLCNFLSAEETKPAAKEARSATETAASVGMLDRSSFSSASACPECVEWLRGHKELIQSDYEKALESFPVLAYSFAVLIQEYEYQHELNRIRTSRGFGAPVDGDSEEIVHPDEIWDWWHKDRREYFDRMAELLAEMPHEDEPQEIDHHWTYCNQVEQAYRSAQDCLERFLANPPQTEAEWAEYQGCLQAIQDYIGARDYCAAYW